MITNKNDKIDNKTECNGKVEDNDNVRLSAAKNMSDRTAPLAKRFYKDVAVSANDDGFGIKLDERAIRTPARELLNLPTHGLAEAVAGEWMAQDAEINPALMPLTRLANTTIDGVAINHADVADDIARFAMTDLLCYRAEGPVELVERQKEQWNRVLSWAEETLAVRFKLAAGVMPVTQDEAISEQISKRLGKISAFELAPLHVMTTLMGSAVLALGVHAKHLQAEAAWAAANIDEDWQISQWGEDKEASIRREYRHQEFLSAAEFLALATD